MVNSAYAIPIKTTFCSLLFCGRADLLFWRICACPVLAQEIELINVSLWSTPWFSQSFIKGDKFNFYCQYPIDPTNALEGSFLII